MFCSPVYPSFFSQDAGGPMWPLPIMHWNSPYRDPTALFPDVGPHCTRITLPLSPTPNMGPHHTWSPPPPDMFKPMKHVKLARGWFASYWNVFLFLFFEKKIFGGKGLNMVNSHILWLILTCCDHNHMIHVFVMRRCVVYTLVFSSGHIFYDWIHTFNANGIYDMLCSAWTI